MVSKLRSNSGETIAEVLIASLVVLLGILLYMMMVTSSIRIIESAEALMKKVYAAESTIESGTIEAIPTNIGIIVNGHDLDSSGFAHPNEMVSIKLIIDETTGIRKFIRASSE